MKQAASGSRRATQALQDHAATRSVPAHEAFTAAIGVFGTITVLCKPVSFPVGTGCFTGARINLRCRMFGVTGTVATATADLRVNVEIELKALFAFNFVGQGLLLCVPSHQNGVKG